jgi:antitoxin component of RelBE/YafQ-DinJ toxin-antitoxin module
MPKTEEMTNFTFKMDRKTRNSYSKLCDDFGLSMSSATLALIRQAVRTQSMSFSMRDENGFTPAQSAELQKRIDEIEQGNVIRHDLIEGVSMRELLWSVGAWDDYLELQTDKAALKFALISFMLNLSIRHA